MKRIESNSPILGSIAIRYNFLSQLIPGSLRAQGFLQPSLVRKYPNNTPFFSKQ